MTTNKKINLTPEQQAIATRSANQEKLKRSPIREDELNDFSLMKNALDLPEPAQKLQDKKIYAFRWCERTPERIDFLTRSELPPMRWGLVTRMVSELEEFVDPMLGCICRLDQALLYKYWEDHARVQKAKMELAEAGLNTGSLEGKKYQMQNKNADVEVMTGKDQKISGSDVIMGDEAIVDQQAGIVEDSSPLGELLD